MLSVQPTPATPASAPVSPNRSRALRLPPLAAQRRWLEPLLLALVLAVWFGYELGSRALWSPDEGRYAEIPREMLASGDFLTPRLNGVKYFEKPPLVYWLEAGAIKVFGLTEWALRLWPALFALLGCLAVYFTGRAFYGRRAGLFAAGVLAISPLYDFMGGILTLDMPLTAQLTMALCAFLAATRAPPGSARRLLFYGFYALTALTVLTKGLIGLAIPVMVIGAWIVVTGGWRWLRAMYLPTGVAIFFAIAAPWHVLVAQANPEFAHFYFIHEHLDRYLTTVHSREEPIWYFVPVLVIGMYPWSVLLPSAVRATLHGLWHKRKERDDIWFLLLWALLPFVFFSFSGSKLIPYILPIFPPLALLLGRWLARVYDGNVSIGRVAYPLLLALGILLAVGFVLIPQLSSDNESVAHIAEQLGTGLYLMAAGLLLAGLLPYLGWWRGNPRVAIIAMFLGAVALVATFDLNLSRLDAGRSVKELALMVKQRLQPADEVMTYEEYYQDLPVYLERRITVVYWRGELEFGASVEDTRDWMIDGAEFRRRWNAPDTKYVLTSLSIYERWRADPPGPMQLLAQRGRVALLVNKEATP